jgi:hypothetical protein
MVGVITGLEIVEQMDGPISGEDQHSHLSFSHRLLGGIASGEQRLLNDREALSQRFCSDGCEDCGAIAQRFCDDCTAIVEQLQSDCGGIAQ